MIYFLIDEAEMVVGDIWGSVPDWVSAISDAGVAFAAIMAALQGIKSLSAWRQETVGRRRMELAEEVLADIYQAREVFQWVRSAASSGSESEARPGREKEPEAIRGHRDTFYVPLKRLSDNAEFFSKANARKYRVIAAFGPDADKPYTMLHEIRVTISSAAAMLMRMDPNNKDDKGARREMQLEADVWEGYGDEDKLSSKIEDMVSVAEERFRGEIG